MEVAVEPSDVEFDAVIVADAVEELLELVDQTTQVKLDENILHSLEEPQNVILATAEVIPKSAAIALDAGETVVAENTPPHPPKKMPESLAQSPAARAEEGTDSSAKRAQRKVDEGVAVVVPASGAHQKLRVTGGLVQSDGPEELRVVDRTEDTLALLPHEQSNEDNGEEQAVTEFVEELLVGAPVTLGVEYGHEASEEAIGLSAVSEETVIVEGIPEVLRELFVDLDQAIEDTEKDEVQAGDQEILAVVDDEMFGSRLVAYVQSLPENPDKPVEAQPSILMENALEIAVHIQQVQEQDAHSDTVEELKEELLVVCVQLLESLGVEPDERAVTRLIEKLLASDLSQVALEALSPEALAKLGTHEYKSEGWFQKRFYKIMKAVDDTRPHRSIGCLALGAAHTPEAA